jgi:hypothetical protein
VICRLAEAHDAVDLQFMHRPAAVIDFLTRNRLPFSLGRGEVAVGPSCLCLPLLEREAVAATKDVPGMSGSVTTSAGTA